MTYPFNDLLNSLFVTLHFQESLDLRQRKVLTVTHSHQFIKRTQELKGIAQNLTLIQALADAGSHLRKKMKTVNILQNI